VHRKTSISKALEYFSKINKRRAVVFLVSDFLDDSYLLNMNLTNKRHDLVAMEVFDPREATIPQVGLIELMDPETGKSVLVDTSNRSWQSSFQQHRDAFDSSRTDYFKKNNIDHLRIRTDQPYGRQLTAFFKMRSRRHKQS